MLIKEDISINAPVVKVWERITDIENSPQFISGINKVEILDKPSNGLKGLKWEETRTMFGKTATEIMWITDYAENKFYKTMAEGPGVRYISTLTVSNQKDKTYLAMEFETEISSMATRIISGIMGIFFNKATKKAIRQDLLDIKASVE